MKEWDIEGLKNGVFLDHDTSDGVGAEIIYTGISTDRSVAFHIIVFSEKTQQCIKHLLPEFLIIDTCIIIILLLFDARWMQ